MTNLVIGSCTTILLHTRDILFLLAPTGPTIHHANNVLKAYSPSFLLGMTSFGSNALEKIPSIKMLILISSF